MSAPFLKSTQSIIQWQNDILFHGSSNFNDQAEETIFDNLRIETAKLFNTNEDNIAGGSSFTELASAVAWGIKLKSTDNIVPQQDQSSEIVDNGIEANDISADTVSEVLDNDAPEWEKKLAKLERK